ncbi:hypothetical protein EMA8858_02042 [Emticicia aquatica]|jgi:hypothetical protein|uniref:Uncharacterized protein n=1 Tax=Emticicia aquatica TaxID=1681835 RepID=A0ABN8EWB4_9BACT|nr:hypothetical protein [Emticicia aquatica]CAH0995914.1 hypothetical protein EMA8858_02042 [Emticicia aquatica]
MIKSAFKLNQTHWRYSVKTTSGLSEERLYEEADEDLYGDAFESDDFDEVFDDSFVDNFSIAA